MDDITTIAIWVACALICYALAEQKDKNTTIAVAVGLLTGFIGVIYYVFSRGSKDYQLAKAKERVMKLESNKTVKQDTMEGGDTNE